MFGNYRARRAATAYLKSQTPPRPVAVPLALTLFGCAVGYWGIEADHNFAIIAALASLWAAWNIRKDGHS